jgi:uncharacterized protein
MKKIMWMLSILLMLGGILSCGGDSSKEAKELLQRILNLVGIPQSIVINLCQDNNDNGFCEPTEPQAKIALNRNDNLHTLIQKFTQTKEGEYLLETYDPTKPFLLELQDNDIVYHDEGKFTIPFNGFNEFNDTKISKELSILQSMIDAKHLTTQDVKSIRNLDTEYAQEKFYEYLLKDLENNINVLREKELNPNEAIVANIKEMAEELLENNITKELPKTLNECEGNTDCVDKKLNEISEELLIDEEEAVTIQVEITKNNTILASKKIVGIPMEKVVNICQDNGDGSCVTSKNQTKNNKNSFHKVSFNGDGLFVFDNYDSTKKVLMELQSEDVHYDNGKFTFSYKPTSGELSIFQTMIDSGYLKANDIKEIRKVEFIDEVYKILLRDFEKNLNILREKGLTSSQAMSANLKETSAEIAENIKELLANLNKCNGDLSCIQNTLSAFSENILITDNELKEILDSLSIKNEPVIPIQNEPIIPIQHEPVIPINNDPYGNGGNNDPYN